jgi:hypothetical protein
MKRKVQARREGTSMVDDQFMKEVVNEPQLGKEPTSSRRSQYKS